MNILYNGGNPNNVPTYLKDECIYLAYVDPPLNSNRNCDILIRFESGNNSEKQITDFEHVALTLGITPAGMITPGTPTRFWIS